MPIATSECEYIPTLVYRLNSPWEYLPLWDKDDIATSAITLVKSSHRCTAFHKDIADIAPTVDGMRWKIRTSVAVVAGRYIPEVRSYRFAHGGPTDQKGVSHSRHRLCPRDGSVRVET